ncbi:MAG: autotransporter-associated beta strand repeat-containing protein, partial [Thermoguttaceae bacterium]
AITINTGGTLDLGGSSYSQATSGAVHIQGGTMSNGTIYKSGAAYDAQSGTVSATLAGSNVGLTKTTSGTLTLSGANTYSGTTEIDEGVLSITGQSNLGSDGLTFNGGTLQITSTCTITKTATLKAGGGTLDVTTGNTVTYSGLIQDGATPGALTKTDTGTLTLAHANTYSGATYITNGTLALGTSDAIADTSSVTINGGTLDLGGCNNSTTGTTNLLNGEITGPGVLSSPAYNLQNGIVYNAILDGSGTLTKSNTGGTVWLMLGASTYTGSTTISGGTLILQATDAIHNTSSVTINGGTLNVDGYNNSMGAITLQDGTITGTTGVLTSSSYNVWNGTISAKLGGGGALTKSNYGTVTLSKANTYSGGTTINAGTLQITDNSAIGTDGLIMNDGILDLNGKSISVTSVSGTGGVITDNSSGSTPSTFTVNNSNNCTFSGSIQIGSNNRTLALTKSGTGTLTLSGSTANTYSGGTVINDGNLEFSTSSSLPDLGQITINSQGALIAAGAKSTAQAWISSGKILNTSTGALALTINEGDIDLSTSPGYPSLSLGAVGYVTYAGAITPGGDTYHLGGGGGTLDLRGTDVLSDNGNTPRSLVVNGSGEVILSGSNNLTGDTTVNSGTLTFGDGNYDGSVAGNITVNSGAYLVFNNNYDQTYNGIISGNGNLIIESALILTNNNDFSGDTTIYGTLQICDGNGINYSGSLTTTGDIFNYGTLFYDMPYGYYQSYTGHMSGNGETIVSEGFLYLTGTIDGNITLVDNGALYMNDDASATGEITINYSCYVDANIPSEIVKTLLINPTSTGILVKTGEGTLHLTSYDYFYCNIENEQGMLYLEACPMEGYIENSANLIFDVPSDFDFYCDSIIYGSGDLTKNGDGNLWINQLNCSGDISINGGALEIGSGTVSGIISGEGSLIKYAGGNLTLSRINIYTGDTIIDGGTLELVSSGQLSKDSSININADGTFLVTGGNSSYYHVVGSVTGAGTLTIGTPSIAGYLEASSISSSVIPNIVNGDLRI